MATLIEQVNEPLLKRSAQDGVEMSEAITQLTRVLLRVYGELKIPATIPAAVGRYELLRETVNARDAAVRYAVAGPVTPEAVKKAARERRLLAVRGKGGEMRFPVWQFRENGGPVPGLGEVLAELAQSPAGEDMEAFAFFLNPNPLTGGVAPIEALRGGRKEAVIRAASAARY